MLRPAPPKGFHRGRRRTDGRRRCDQPTERVGDIGLARKPLDDALRRCLSKGKGHVIDKLQKMAAKKRADARLAKIVPYNFDTAEKPDPMALLEEVMQHFYRKAKIEESLGRFCDFRIVDNALQNAARIAREIVSFRRPPYQCHQIGCGRP